MPTYPGKAKAQRSYFACSAGGATIETLREYLQSQATPD